MRKRYPTDLKDKEWEILEKLIPAAKSGGRPREQNMREILNAIFYILRAGCAWDMLPKDFPPKSTVFYYFNTWRKDGTWKRFNDILRCKLRPMEWRREQPSAGIMDSQTVKTSDTAMSRGYDAGKKINGRKRHILVDTIGLIMLAVVHAGNIQDRDGAKILLAKARTLFPTLKLIWADGGYAGKLVNWVFTSCSWVLEIVKRNSKLKGFHILPRRWVVERTFGWFSKYRRLSKDYEYYEESSEAVIYACMTHIMLRRLAR